MSILLNKVQYNISRINKILDLNVQKKFYNVTEFKPNINGEVEIHMVCRGSSVLSTFYTGIVNIPVKQNDIAGAIISLVIKNNERSNFELSVGYENDGRDRKYISKKLKVNKNDVIKIQNNYDNDGDKIIKPNIKLNDNTVVLFDESNLVPNSGRINYYNNSEDFNNLIIGETYIYSYPRSSYNGQQPGEGGRLGKFKFKYLGKTTIMGLPNYSIDVLNKERDGVPFPHGEVIISFKLDIDKISFDENKFKSSKKELS